MAYDTCPQVESCCNPQFITGGVTPNIFYNTAQTATALCPYGGGSGSFSYTVPANTFSSYISVADANAQAYSAALAIAQASLECSIAGALNGIQWRIPGGPSASDPADVTAILTGQPGHTYAVTFRIRGVFEERLYPNMPTPSGQPPQMAYWSGFKSISHTLANFAIPIADGSTTVNVPVLDSSSFTLAHPWITIGGWPFKLTGLPGGNILTVRNVVGGEWGSGQAGSPGTGVLKNSPTSFLPPAGDTTNADFTTSGLNIGTGQDQSNIYILLISYPPAVYVVNLGTNNSGPAINGCQVGDYQSAAITINQGAVVTLQARTVDGQMWANTQNLTCNNNPVMFNNVEGPDPNNPTAYNGQVCELDVIQITG